ncbi:MAG TPA: aldo/keto reductase, partial [Candidatus Acidoferrales bacterium]|nr:aldo/keto reductase [Candidatus Acidoferrales bacterium]
EVLRNGIIDQCMQRRVTLLAWSPMAGGKLGLSVEQAATETNGERLASLIECLDGIAAAQQATRTAVALAFLLTHPAGVVPILGTQRVERIRDSLATFKVRLRRVDWYAIVQASQGKRLP